MCLQSTNYMQETRRWALVFGERSTDESGAVNLLGSVSGCRYPRHGALATAWGYLEEEGKVRSCSIAAGKRCNNFSACDWCRRWFLAIHARKTVSRFLLQNNKSSWALDNVNISCDAQFELLTGRQSFSVFFSAMGHVKVRVKKEETKCDASTCRWVELKTISFWGMVSCMP